jgi:hypothetical protein
MPTAALRSKRRGSVPAAPRPRGKARPVSKSAAACGSPVRGRRTSRASRCYRSSAADSYGIARNADRGRERRHRRYAPRAPRPTAAGCSRSFTPSGTGCDVTKPTGDGRSGLATVSDRRTSGLPEPFSGRSPPPRRSRRRRGILLRPGRRVGQKRPLGAFAPWCRAFGVFQVLLGSWFSAGTAGAPRASSLAARLATPTLPFP